MKKMKYLLALCLTLAAVGSFAACGNNSNVADTSMVENTQRGGSAADDAGKAGCMLYLNFAIIQIPFLKAQVLHQN